MPPSRPPRHARSTAQTPSLQAEIGKKRPFASPEEEAFLNIIRTAAELAADSERVLKAHGLSEATYNALRILRGHGPPGVPSQTIGAQMVARVPDVTRIVDRLVDAGLAERSRTDADRRVVVVRITPAGQDLLARIDEPILAVHRGQLGHLSREELDDLNRLLVRARAAVVRGAGGGDGDRPGESRARKPGRR